VPKLNIGVDNEFVTSFLNAHTQIGIFKIKTVALIKEADFFKNIRSDNKKATGDEINFSLAIELTLIDFIDADVFA